MSKYEPLTAFLSAKPKEPLEMTVKEVERVLGFELPKSAKLYSAWWSNSDDSHVQATAWLAAGFETSRVDLQLGQVTFAPAQTSIPNGGFVPLSNPGGHAVHHPAYGALKGMITLLPDVDLTEPAYGEWKKLYGEDA